MRPNQTARHGGTVSLAAVALAKAGAAKMATPGNLQGLPGVQRRCPFTQHEAAKLRGAPKVPRLTTGQGITGGFASDGLGSVVEGTAVKLSVVWFTGASLPLECDIPKTCL
jgi:hypothetical protein